jgi:L-rhamnose mutarotase
MNYKYIIFTLLLFGQIQLISSQSTPGKSMIPGQSNTFSPAIGFGKKGLTLGATKNGFTKMEPVFYAAKQPEIKVNKQTNDSLSLPEKYSNQIYNAELYTTQRLKIISDSILNDGLNLYKLERLALVSKNEISQTNFDKLLVNDHISYFDNDSVKTIYYYHDLSSIKIVFTASINRNDSIVTKNIYLKKTARTPSSNELRLIEIKEEIKNFIKESPSLSENLNVMNFSISVQEKQNLLYFYLLPSSFDESIFYLGGDYIIKYSKDKKLLAIDPQHKCLITVKNSQDTKTNSFTHTHIQDYSMFITPSDICQATLYGRLTVDITNYHVITTYFDSYFNTETSTLKISMNKK